MKKSSRDYRRNNRKKWIKINQQKMMLAITSMNADMQCYMIQTSPFSSIQEKYISIAELAINAHIQLQKILNPDKNLDLSHAESVLSEPKQSTPALFGGYNLCRLRI